jgi:hypothetical protein
MVTIFGRTIGAKDAVSPTGLRKPTLIGRNATATKTKGQNAQARGPAKGIGNTGANGLAAANAGSDVFCFTTTIAPGGTFTFPLSDDGDFIAQKWGVSVTAGSASLTTDILAAISLIEFIGPGGPIIDFVPTPDFYLFLQRFGEYGASTTPTTIAQSATVTTSATITYYVPCNLPAAKGNYTIVITAASAFNAAVSLSTTVTLEMRLGTCPDGIRTRYKATSPAWTPATGLYIDAAPLAPIQDIELQEIFITGLTSNGGSTTAADITYMQIQSLGSSIATKLTSGSILSGDAQALSGAVGGWSANTVIYPLLALGSTLVLGRSAHLYLQYLTGAPSATSRFGYVWFD